MLKTKKFGVQSKISIRILNLIKKILQEQEQSNNFLCQK